MVAESAIEVVVRSLCFGEDRRNELQNIPASAWPRLLSLLDESRLTLPLAIRCEENVPPAVRERIGLNLESNRRRHAEVLASWQEIAGALQTRGIDFLTLKGLSHWPFYCDKPADRPQYDIDLYCPADHIGGALEAIARLGYEPLHPRGAPATDHLPAMIRKTGYQWRGDYFDPSLPLTVELHYQFRDPGRECFELRNDRDFWIRRKIRNIDGMQVPALHPVDCLSYATWHVMRHLMAGNLRLYHVYELAQFLDRTQDQDSFWLEWEFLNSGRAGLPERIALRLASEWFGCRMHATAREAIARLPRAADRWFDLFAWSPVRALEHVNKDEIFLHLALVSGWRKQLRIAARRVFPRNIPQIVLDAHNPAANTVMKMRRGVFQARHIARRAARHFKSLFPVARSAARWCVKR